MELNASERSVLVALYEFACGSSSECVVGRRLSARVAFQGSSVEHIRGFLELMFDEDLIDDDVLRAHSKHTLDPIDLRDVDPPLFPGTRNADGITEYVRLGGPESRGPPGATFLTFHRVVFNEAFDKAATEYYRFATDECVTDECGGVGWFVTLELRDGGWEVVTYFPVQL